MDAQMFFCGLLSIIILSFTVIATSEVNQPCKIDKPKGCEDIRTTGSSKSGVFQIFGDDNSALGEVWCDLETDGGGWTVIQRRAETIDNAEDFFRTWAEYQNGFGRLDNSHWLGLDKIAELTKSGEKQLRVELTDWENIMGMSVYDQFIIGNEDTLYKLNVSGFFGGAGDSLTPYNNMMFSAKDVDNDSGTTTNCSATRESGWWHANCGTTANLNGHYFYGSAAPLANGVFWATFRLNTYSLKRVEMKIRRRDFDSRVNFC